MCRVMTLAAGSYETPEFTPSRLKFRYSVHDGRINIGYTVYDILYILCIIWYMLYMIYFTLYNI